MESINRGSRERLCSRPCGCATPYCPIVSLCALLAGGAIDQPLEVFPHPRDDQRLCLQFGMYAIALHEFRLCTNTAHHLWQQGQVELTRQVAVDSAKTFRVERTVIGWQLDADQHHLRTALPDVADHGRQVLFHFLQRQTTQAVVTTQFQDYDGRLVPRQHLWQSGPAGRRGVSADTCIDNRERQLFVVDALLQQRHPAPVDRHAVGGAEAVTDNHDGFCIAGQQ